MSNFSKTETAAPALKLIEWTTDYAVNIPEIDGEHQNLFAMINRLHEALLNGQGTQLLSALLTELTQYVQEHFSHEETLMVASHYPALEAHLQQHRALQRKVRTLVERLARGEVTMTIELTLFLSEWIRKHTMTTDRRFGDFLNAAHH